MPRFMETPGQAARRVASASARPAAAERRPEPADFTDSAQTWDGLELAIAPEFHLRMIAWSIGISSVLWYSLILAGVEVWKVWR